MIPVKLSVNGIYDSDAVYSFGNAKDVYPINEAEKIKQCIGYAVFGNDTLYRGSISFEFVYGGKNYIVSRNFEKNTVALTVNGTLMPEQAETEKILRETMLLTPGQWSEIAIASKHEAYDSAVKDVKKFSENFYSTLDIDTDTVENSVAQYRDEISAVGNKAEALKKLMPNTDGLEERRKNLGDEIASMKADAAKLSRLVGIGEFNKATAEKLAAVNEKLACEEAKATKIETDGKRLEKSKAIKEHFAFMKEAAGAEADAAAVKEQIETKSGDAARLASEIAAGGKVVAKKQRAYIDSAERIKALGAALDEEIGENLASGKNEEYILGKAGEYCAEGAKTLEELKKIEEETLAEKKKTDEALAAVKDEFDSVRVNAEYRKGVREGACFETLITARKAQSECVAEAIGKENVSLEFLQKQLAENEETVAQCKLKYAQIFGNGDEEKTVKTLISEFNELERIKQGIYRNQIISASLLQEIDAIDKKIGENTEMKRSCEENSRSLENAKRTLILYTEKCSDRLSEISETLIEAKSVLKLSDDVDRLEYGGICPVCSGLVADKADRSAETETARKKADEAEAEKTHLTEILDEYSEKLEKINIRLGELTSRNAASASYIGSLENTKLAKLETLRNLYAECKVSSHSELTDDLEQVIAEIGRTGAYISDVKEVVETEKLAKRAAEEIRTHIAELTGKIIPGEQAELDKLAEDGRRLEKEYEYFEKILGGEAALSKLDAMISVEKKEDELYDRAKKLISEKSELDARLLDIAKDKAVLEYRAYPITKGEKEYSYAALCINLTSEYYNEIIAEIREEEKTKQKIQDEMVAVTRILKDKQTAFNALKEEIDKLQRQLDADNAYMKMLRESESCDARLLEETDFDTVKNEIIDDKAAESLKEEIKAYEADITKYRCEADALNDILSQTKEAYEELDGNAAAEKELAGMLNEREKEYGAVSGTIEFAKKLSDAMSELGIEQAELQKRLSELASGEVGDLIITKINNALNLLLPQYRVKPKNEGLAVLFTDKNGLEKEMPRLEDEEYITLSISIISAAVQIAEEALHTEALLRIVRVQANLVKDETKAKLAEFGQKNNLIIMFHK